MDPKLVEDWLRLTADALKGTEDARRAFESLGRGPISPDLLSRWAAAWLPHRPLGGGDPEQLQKVVEEWWEALGVVPRHRYLELLKKHEELRDRLEEAEATVKNLRKLLREGGHEPEARKVLDEWEETTKKTLESQAEWARRWTEAMFGAGSGEKK